MKIILGLLVFINLLFAVADNKLIIDANSFKADDKKGITTFSGDVKMTKGDSQLNSDKLEIIFTPRGAGSRKVIEYIATGDVYFKIKIDDNKIYIAKGDKISFNPQKEIFIITGNGILEEQSAEQKLYGEKIFFNKKSGEATIEGKKNKPVRFIMTLD